MRKIHILPLSSWKQNITARLGGPFSVDLPLYPGAALINRDIHKSQKYTFGSVLEQNITARLGGPFSVDLPLYPGAALINRDIHKSQKYTFGSVLEQNITAILQLIFFTAHRDKFSRICTFV